MKWRKIFREWEEGPELWRDAVLLLLLAAVCVLLYGHTLDVPWYLDDKGRILGNPYLGDFSATAARLFSSRGFFYLTLALNARFTGLELTSLHLTNIIIHGAAAVVAYLLLRRLLGGRLLPLGAALLFLAHPVQTQAVTYLVQRAASLCGLLVLLAFYAYVRAKECWDRKEKGRAWYGASLVLAALAVLTKENSATFLFLPLFYERFFSGEDRCWRTIFARVLPFAVAPLILGLIVLLGPPLAETIGLTTDIATLQHNSPLHYLVTQFQVIWIYLRLCFFPVGLALEYDYPVAAALMNGPSLIALGGLVALTAFLWRLRYRCPLVVFGLVWFFSTLAVESSFIPLDPLFEHRLYLPLFGLCLALADGLRALLGPDRAVTIFVALSLLCAPLTWQRNSLWREPIAFYEDNLKKAPQSERVRINLANLYLEVGRLAEARDLLTGALAVNPRNLDARENLAMTYALSGEPQRAEEILNEGERLAPDDPEAYGDLASLMLMRRDPAGAIAVLQRGIQRLPDAMELYNNLGVLYASNGEWTKAVMAYRRTLELGGETAEVHDNLAEALLRLGRPSEALYEQRLAVTLAPTDVRMLFNLGQLAMQQGVEEDVRRVAKKLKRLDLQGYDRLHDEARQRGFTGWE